MRFSYLKKASVHHQNFDAHGSVIVLFPNPDQKKYFCKKYNYAE